MADGSGNTTTAPPRLLDTVDRAGIKDGMSREDIAALLEHHLLPEVRVIERTDEKLVLDITSSVDAGLICGVVAGNLRLADYTYPDGKQSGLIRFGQCDRIVSQALGEQLISIVQIDFTRPVDIGDTIRLTLTRIESVESIKPAGFITTSEIACNRLSDGKPVMRPIEVKTYRPPE